MTSSASPIAWSSSSSTCSAISQGAAVAVAYAVRHPERVRHLVILNGYAAGWAVRGRPAGGRAARGDADAHGSRLGRGQSGVPPVVHQHLRSRGLAQADGLVQRDAAPVRLSRECGSPAAGAVKDRRSRSAAAGDNADPDLPFARGPGRAVLAGRGACGGHPGRAVRAARKPQPHPDRKRARVADVRRDQPRVPRPRRATSCLRLAGADRAKTEPSDDPR